MKLRYSFSLLTLFVTTLVAQTAVTPPPTRPDDRFKADVLLVVAHPDDETGVSAYLAQLLDQHKRVAAVYLTHGEAGHNNMGPERATSLGAVREMELRRATTKLGIDNVWFLDGRDTPSQNVLQSLARWNHGTALEEVVRMVRFTRPEVILTWLPGFFIGENHGDHQASGVVATEAFDMAGDPAVFPAQLAAPVRVNETLLEGLRPWQPKKIYYFSDAQDQEPFKNSGPQYPVTGISPLRKLPYWRIAVEAFEFHLSQYRTYIESLSKLDEQQLAKKAKEDGWDDPVQLIFGKSNVGGSVTSDVFEGVGSGDIAFVQPAEGTVEPQSELSAKLAGPWGFYEAFRRAHALHLPQPAVPEIAIASGTTLQIPIVLRNHTAVPRQLTLSVTAPEGWTVQTGAANYTLPAGEELPVQVTLDSPKAVAKATDEIICRAEADGQTIGTITLHVRRRAGGLPQN